MMKCGLITTVFLGVLGSCCLAEDLQPATAARTTLERWQGANTKLSERVLHIVCWTPSDREFPERHQERLTRILLHIQNFYADEMERHGFGRRTFALKQDENKRIALIEVRGTHPASHYRTESGSEIRTECLPVLRKQGIDADKETIAIFCNLATWDKQTLTFSAKAPYYAGGNYRSGTTWQLDSLELDTDNLPAKEPIVHDAQYGDISLGKHNSIFIGGIAHELGHAFGLPHCKERPDEKVRGTSLMGSGNQTYGDEVRGEGAGTFLPFADALRLASHPLFCGRLETGDVAPKTSLTQLAVRADGRAIVVSGVITGTPSVYGIVAYFDPEGGADYNQTSMATIPTSEGRFELRSDALEPGRAGVLHLVPLHANGAVGNSATLHLPYKVGEDGTPDLEQIETRLALAPIVEALGRKQLAQARRLSKGLKVKRAVEIAEVLLSTEVPAQTPAQYDGTDTELSLTAFKADTAEVGWLAPMFNAIPESVLLESSGEIFARGIYAHAPARHEYALGGKWHEFHGQVGLATGHAGTVQFEIKGDGRSLWQSPTVQSDQIVPFKVEVQGVSKLELIASPTADGNGADWGLWLEPELVRTP